MMKQSTKALIFLVAVASCISEARAFLPAQKQHLAFVLPTRSITHRSISSIERNSKTTNDQDEWKDEDHLIHNAREIHEDTPEELREEEDLAAWDAHDCNDAGMEAAAEARALMMVQEMAHKLHQDALNGISKNKKNTAANDNHLIHGASEIHEDTEEELREEEDLAAWDAHDCSDAGMEAAAEERALMLAQEIAHQMHEEALLKKKKKMEMKQAEDEAK